jgi:hypothetical protein
VSDPEKTDQQVGPTPVKPPRDERGRILKGHSLNPGGRPKSLSARIRQDLGGDGQSVVERLRGIWDGSVPGFGPRERLEAGKILLDRGWGRAPETQIQIQAEASDIEGAAEIAGEALSELAGYLGDPADPPTVGGTEGGIVHLNPRKQTG